MRKKKKHAVIFLLLSVYAFFFFPLSPLLAQTSDKADRFPPAIQHNPFRTALNLEDPVIFQANISDNQAVREVHLFYRTTGRGEYVSLKMEWIGGKDYLTIIPQRFVHWPGIEYYIQASDAAGNTSTQGFPNAPLLVEFNAPPKQAEQSENINPPILPPEKKGFRLSTTSTTTEKTDHRAKPWYKKWWVWTIALSVVAGVAAASSSGSGDPSPPAGTTTGTGSVTGGIP